MQHLEVSGAVRHIYVIRQLRVNYEQRHYSHYTVRELQTLLKVTLNRIFL